MNPTHVFLLIGQSNMAGRGAMAEVPVLHHDRVLMWRAGGWLPAVEPLHQDKPTIAGVGLGMSFGVTIADAAPARVVGLLPCAFGGTRLAEWAPGQPLYATAVATARAAGNLAGILWHQGEGDAGRPDDAATYGDRLAAVMTSLRADLDVPDVPIVVGELGEFLDPGKYVGIATVNAHLHGMVDRLPHVACVSAAGLTHKGDDLHFDAVSLREFGRRYAAAWESLAKAQEDCDDLA